MPKVTDYYCWSLIFFYLEVTINHTQLDQDLDKCFSNFKTTQKYTQTTVADLCIAARNKAQEASKRHAESIRHLSA